jgi:HD-GYP domain-containing protein (c-di-GMP phosphodiesterase class II)
MSHFKSLENAGEGALYHHERYDGKGYPEGKAGEEIPFIARIICVADSYDAMNTNRVYRNRLSKEHILEEIERCKGKQFDPKIADIMISLIKNDKLEDE